MEPPLLPLVEHPTDFPDVNDALIEPDGLLAVSPFLTPALVFSAYERGIFPWFSEGDPVLWWAPSKRAILSTKDIKIRRSLKKRIRQGQFKVSINKAFEKVISLCSQVPRKEQQGTWITSDMIQTYITLFNLKKAHSIEVWQDEKLVGGLYGIRLNGLFCGESMFSLVPDASKVCLVALCQHLNQLSYPYIDCQLMTPHLEFMGAIEITRDDFQKLLISTVKMPTKNDTSLSQSGWSPQMLDLIIK